jgi:acyl-homoserine lactone acylase PvdQ
MDLYRRAGAGRLAQVLGEPALESDKQFRTFGLGRVAARELTLLRADTRANLVAYADGVNKFLDNSLSVTPEGESGQPGSKYWDDQAPLWNAGDYKPMRFSRERLGRLDGTLVFRSP